MKHDIISNIYNKIITTSSVVVSSVVFTVVEVVRYNLSFYSRA